MSRDKFEKDEGCYWMCTQYTFAATLVYYIDYAFDILNGTFLTWPQDILHYLLFLVTLPIRLLGLCWDKCYRSTRVGMRDLVSENKNSNCLSRFGVMLHKEKKYKRSATDILKEKNKDIWEWNRMHFCMVNFKVERWDSLKMYADIGLLTAISYFWFSAFFSFQEDGDQQFIRFVRTMYDATGYDVDMSDITFVCIWLFLRILLQVSQRVYLLMTFVKYRNEDLRTQNLKENQSEDLIAKGKMKEKKWNMIGLLFG